MSYFYSVVNYMYLYVSCSGSITSVGRERANLSAFVYNCTYYYVISVWISFLFLLILGIGCFILLWRSLGIPYNCIDISVMLYMI